MKFSKLQSEVNNTVYTLSNLHFKYIRIIVKYFKCTKNIKNKFSDVATIINVLDY